MARDFRRQLAPLQNAVASGVTSYDLPRTSVYKEILLRLELQLSAGAAAPTGLFGRAPFTNIKRIELVADGKDTIKSYDGPMLLDINNFDFGTYPLVGDLTPGIGVNVGLQNLLLVMSLESVGMKQPSNTLLDARKLSSLELRVTWGAGAADLWTTVNNGAIDTQRITPFGHEILDIDPKSTFAVNQEFMISTNFPTNTATETTFRLNVGNAYRRIILHSVDSNARAEIDRLTQLKLVENGTFTRRSWPAGLLKEHNSRKLGGLTTGLGVGDAPVASPAQASGGPATGQWGGPRLGAYEIDIAEDGELSSVLDTRGYSDLQLSLDWNGANTTDLLRWCPAIILPARATP